MLRLAGPTSFSPIIETTIDIVEKSGRRYHVLLIIADGQVSLIFSINKILSLKVTGKLASQSQYIVRV